MTKRLSISVDDWIDSEILAAKNKSARVQELIIKGWMAEKGIGFKKE